MGAKRVIWHVGFERNLRRRGPRSFEIRSEVPLSDEPPRPDYLILRKLTAPGEVLDDHAETLIHLWPLLPKVSVVEYKSPSRPYRLAWEDLRDGYWRVRGGLFELFVIEIDVVGQAEGDDLLYSLGHGDPTTAPARWFWAELLGSKEAAMNVQDMEGYEEMMQKLLASLPPERRLAGLPPEQRLAGLAPEQRLAGLPPEQRLADLDRDHQALALPVELLRLLPEEYIRSLSPEVQEELRRRLQPSGH